MCCIRYEFGGTGIFHALDILFDCDMEQADAEDLERAEYILERDLPHPDIDWKDTQSRFTCWFTEKGVAAFESAGMGEMRIIQREIAEQSIVYRDDFQVVTTGIDPSHSRG